MNDKLFERAPRLGEIPLEPRHSIETIPLTYTQLARWRAFQIIGMQRNTRTCNIALRLPGRFDISAMRSTFDLITRRHESLRTRIIVNNGVPEQIIDEPSDRGLQVHDLSRLPATSVLSAARSLVEAIVNEPVDMAVGPLFRAALIKLVPYDFILVIAVDHVVSDGMSLGILLRDVQAGYANAARGVTIGFSQIPIQFPDFAIWQQKTHPSRVEEQNNFFAEYFRGVDPKLFSSFLPAEAAPAKWAALPIRLGTTLCRELLACSRHNCSTLPIAVLTVFIAVLLRLSERRDAVIGCMSTGRHRPEILNTVGFFASTIYLRIETTATDSFCDLLRHVTASYFTIMENQDFGMTALSARQPNFAKCPSFNWHYATHSAQRALAHGNELSSSGGRGDNRPTLFPFARRAPEMDWASDLPIYGGQPWLVLSGSAAGIAGQIRYRSTHLADELIQRFVNTFGLVANCLATSPDALLSEIPLR